jgi:hypothetical protein
MGTNGYRKPLDNFEWIRKAASTDQARPVLCGYNVTDGLMAATDGHRLHIAPRLANGQPGVWTFSGEEIDGRYPTWAQVVPEGPANLEIQDLAGMIAITSAAMAARKVLGVDGAVSCVSLPTQDGGYAHVKPSLLLDALMGGYARYGGYELQLFVQSALKPIRLDIDNGRRAVIMPFRVGNGLEDVGPSKRFDLSEFVKVVGS